MSKVQRFRTAVTNVLARAMGRDKTCFFFVSNIHIKTEWLRHFKDVRLLQSRKLNQTKTDVMIMR